VIKWSLTGRARQARASEHTAALAFIAPVFWLHFPAILKGWFERVCAYGEAYALTADGWRGEVRGRIPLLRHGKVLVISTTLFLEAVVRRASRSASTSE
jgi:NAD(P)H dehydrogenase (quinone)